MKEKNVLLEDEIKRLMGELAAKKEILTSP